jgi:hypothetical protein
MGSEWLTEEGGSQVYCPICMKRSRVSPVRRSLELRNGEWLVLCGGRHPTPCPLGRRSIQRPLHPKTQRMNGYAVLLLMPGELDTLLAAMPKGEREETLKSLG